MRLEQKRPGRASGPKTLTEATAQRPEGDEAKYHESQQHEAGRASQAKARITEQESVMQIV